LVGLAEGGLGMSHVRARTAEQVSGSPPEVSERGRPLTGGFIGLAAGGVALGAAQLAAGVAGGASSPMIAVGGAAIDATPEWLKSFAIRTFGSDDKLALLVGIGAILAIAAAVIGILAVPRPLLGLFGIVAFGLIGIIASVTRPTNGLSASIPSIL